MGKKERARRGARKSRRNLHNTRRKDRTILPKGTIIRESDS